DFITQRDVLRHAKRGATFLLNSPYGPNEVWSRLPREVQTQIRVKQLRFYVLDAYGVAMDVGLGRRINTVMQTAFFAISGVLPAELAISRIKAAIEKSYGNKGPELVKRNLAAVDAARQHLHVVPLPEGSDDGLPLPPVVPEHAPDFVQR